ncbi:MAG: GGDEF domain-containing protein [Anaerostipes sp.]|nr:GGDEF domain-containing protein [Anaerostipes sp.]
MNQILISISGDLLGIIELCFIIFLLKQNEILSTKKTKQYLMVAYLTLFVILLEIGSVVLHTYGVPETRILSYIVNIFGFSITFLLPVAAGILYSDKVERNKKWILIPVGIGVLLCICSIWTGWIFYIDAQGFYHRGNYFLANTLISIYGLGILLYAHTELAKEYDNHERRYLRAMLIVTMATIGIQILIPKILIIWAGVASMELLYYVFLRELQFKYDAVTGVWNRTIFELDLTRIQPRKGLYLVECDVNDLKKVNDTLGHSIGDKYLKDCANIIQNTYGKYGRTYRIGGDEFVVIVQDCTCERLEQARNEMLEELTKIKGEYPVHCYIANAYVDCNSSIHENITDCLKDVDLKMYMDKIRSKEI